MPVTSSTDLSPPQKRRESQSHDATTEGDPEEHSPLSTSLRSFASSDGRFRRPLLKPNLRWAIPEWCEGGTAVIVVQFLVTKSEDVIVEMIGPDQLWFRCRGQHREDVNLPRGSMVARHAEQKAFQFRRHHHILGRVGEKGDHSSRQSFSIPQQQLRQPTPNAAKDGSSLLAGGANELDENGQPCEDGSDHLDDFDVIISLWGSATLLDQVPTRCLDHIEVRLVPLGPQWERLTRHSPGELPFLVSYAWELEGEAGRSAPTATQPVGESNLATSQEDHLSDLNSIKRRRSSSAATSASQHPNSTTPAGTHQHPHGGEEDHPHHKDEGIRWLWSKESLLSIAVASILFGVEAFLEYHRHHGHHR